MHLASLLGKFYAGSDSCTWCHYWETSSLNQIVALGVTTGEKVDADDLVNSWHTLELMKKMSLENSNMVGPTLMTKVFFSWMLRGTKSVCLFSCWIR